MLAIRFRVVVGVTTLAIGIAACSGSAGSAPAVSQVPATPGAVANTAAAASVAASPTAATSASPSAAAVVPPSALAVCLDPAVYALIKQERAMDDAGRAAFVKTNAAALIAGLENWAPPQAADATYRDQVVEALKKQDWANARLLIGDVMGQWHVIPC
jgi:hypothetical protein